MSVPTTIQSKLVPMAVSTDGGATYKNLVCLKTWDWTSQYPTTDELTQCGVFRSEGVQDTQFNFEIIVNTTPNGATEISSLDVINIFKNRTDVFVKTISGATGQNITAYGRFYQLQQNGTGAPGLLNIKGQFKNNGQDATFA